MCVAIWSASAVLPADGRPARTTKSPKSLYRRLSSRLKPYSMNFLFVVCSRAKVSSPCDSETISAPCFSAVTSIAAAMSSRPSSLVRTCVSLSASSRRRLTFVCSCMASAYAFQALAVLHTSMHSISSGSYSLPMAARIVTGSSGRPRLKISRAAVYTVRSSARRKSLSRVAAKSSPAIFGSSSSAPMTLYSAASVARFSTTPRPPLAAWVACPARLPPAARPPTGGR